MSEIIIGLDPGSIKFGYSVLSIDKSVVTVVNYGTIKLKPNLDLACRLKVLFEELDKIFKKAHPDYLSVENVFIHKNVKSSFVLAHARAVGLLLGALYNTAVFEYSPRKVKLSVTGNGNSDKIAVKKMVCSFLGLLADDLDDDSSDALAIALCCFYNKRKGVNNKKKTSNKWSLDYINSNNLNIVGGT